MNEEQVEMVRQELLYRNMDELVGIWQAHNQAVWTEEAFEAIRQILLARLGQVPDQDNRDEADRRLSIVQQYLDTGEPERALEECEGAVQAALHYAEVYNARGMVLDELGRLDEAIDSYEEAMRLNPGLAPAVRKSIRYASKERDKRDREQKEPVEIEQALLSTTSGGYYSSLFRDAWRLTWRNKWIWASSVLYVGYTELIGFIDKSSWLYLLLEFLNLVILLLFTAGLTRVIYCTINRMEFRASDIWKVARKSSFRLLGANLLILLVCIPFEGLVVIGIKLYSSFPWVSIFLILSTVIIMVSLQALYQFLEIDLVLHEGSFRERVKQSTKAFLQNIVGISILTAVFLLTNISFVRSILIPVAFFPQYPIGIFIMEGLRNLTNNTYYWVYSIIQSLMYWSFGMSAFVLLYLRIMSAERKDETVSTVVSQQY